MTLPDALLQAILDSPDDDLPRLAYADWLEENGDELDRARGELIRLELRLHRLEADDPARAPLASRKGELLKRHGKSKLLGLGAAWAESERGFVSRVSTTAKNFLQDAEALSR